MCQTIISSECPCLCLAWLSHSLMSLFSFSIIHCWFCCLQSPLPSPYPTCDSLLSYKLCHHLSYFQISFDKTSFTLVFDLFPLPWLKIFRILHCISSKQTPYRYISTQTRPQRTIKLYDASLISSCHFISIICTNCLLIKENYYREKWHVGSVEQHQSEFQGQLFMF